MQIFHIILPFLSSPSLKTATNVLRLLCGLRTDRKETNKCKQTGRHKYSNSMFFCPTLSVSFLFFLFVSPGLSSSHTETLCQTDVCSCKMRHKQKRQRANKETTERCSLCYFVQTRLYGQILNSHMGTAAHSWEHTGANNHIAVSNQVCSPNYAHIWRVVTHD